MYDKNYLEYDEYGLKSVNCMRCNKPVKIREYKEVEHNGKLINIAYIKELNDFKPTPFMLSNGSYTNILLCTNCAKNKENNEEEQKGMTKQFKRGHELEAKYAKKSNIEIKYIANTYGKLKVMNRIKTMKLKGAS